MRSALVGSFKVVFFVTAFILNLKLYVGLPSHTDVPVPGPLSLAAILVAVSIMLSWPVAQRLGGLRTVLLLTSYVIAASKLLLWMFGALAAMSFVATADWVYDYPESDLNNYQFGVYVMTYCALWGSCLAVMGLSDMCAHVADARGRFAGKSSEASKA